MFKNNDIYYLLRDFNTNTRNLYSRTLHNDFLNNRNIQNVERIRRHINVYDYIIISNNNYKNTLQNINNKLNILILEKNEKIEDIELPKNIDIRYNKQLLSIEKYIYNDNVYCVFETLNRINYFSENIIISNDAIKSNVIMNNTTKEEQQQYIKLQQLKEETDFMLNQSNYKTIKYYVRSTSKNYYNNEYIFSNTPNGKSINNILVLEKGNKYIFEMTSDFCPFHINASLNHNILFIINSNKYIHVKNASILKGETIEFYIPEKFNKTILYFCYFNRFIKSKKYVFKLVHKKSLKNMFLTFN